MNHCPICGRGCGAVCLNRESIDVVIDGEPKTVPIHDLLTGYRLAQRDIQTAVIESEHATKH
jgi:hypothetical protein